MWGDGGAGGAGPRSPAQLRAAAPNVVDAVGVTSWNPSTITIKSGEIVQFPRASSPTHSVRFDQDVAGHPDDVENFASATRSVTFTTPGQEE